MVHLFLEHLLVSSHDGRGEGSLFHLFYKGTNFIHEGYTFMTSSFLKALLFPIYHFEFRVLINEFWEKQSDGYSAWP
jgi:hypothetical protein